jgi:hypothetical protein
VLTIPAGFQCGDAVRVVALAVAWESELRTLVLEGVVPHALPLFLQTLFVNSPFLTRLILESYISPPSGEIDFQAIEKSKLCELTFKNVNTLLMFAILRALAKFEGRITTLVISRCKMLADHYATFYQLLANLPVFIGLANLRLEDGAADGLDLPQFSEFLAVPRMRSLTLAQFEVDVAAVLSAIAPRLASVRHLCLTSGRMLEHVQRDLAFSAALVCIDLTRTAVQAAPLKAFLRELVTKPRRQLLMLVLADLALAEPAADVMAAFEIPDAQPVLAEFSFSGNDIAVRELPKLLAFLRTQKHLQFLALSRCFRENVDQAIDEVAEFVVDARLQGLEINSDPQCPLGQGLPRLLAKLAKRASLSTLIVERSGAGDAGLDALKKFVEATPKLTGLACDGMKPGSADALVRGYAGLARLERIAPPRADLALFPSAQMPANITAKPPPKMTPVARAADYEGFNADGESAAETMVALLGLMRDMAGSLVTPEIQPNIFAQRNVYVDIKSSLVTSIVPLRA